MRVADDQNHAGTQRRDIPVVVLQGGDRGVVGSCDRRQGLALLDFVMDNGNRAGRCSLRSGPVLCAS